MFVRLSPPALLERIAVANVAKVPRPRLRGSIDGLPRLGRVLIVDIERGERYDAFERLSLARNSDCSTSSKRLGHVSTNQN
jgi:hypothetical protein